MDVLFGLGLYSTSVSPSFQGYHGDISRHSQAYHFIGMKKYLEKGMVFIPVSA
jgi:hypothetical protein